MKKFRLLLLVCIGLLYNSCEDAYNIVQDGEFSEAATFKTVADMELFMMSVYDAASTLNQIGYTAIVTDEVAEGSQNAGQQRDLYGYILNSNEAYADAMWIGQYTLIDRANRLLRGAARITPEASEVAKYNSIIAQARVLRAFGHFQLLTFFSTDLKNDNALGVILMDRVAETTEKLPRNTNGEVFALIESDLNFAYANLVDYNGYTTAPNNKLWTFLSKAAIDAFRARMYAYRGNYPLALQYANAAIAASPVLTPATPVVPATVTAAVGTNAWNNSYYNATNPTNPYRRMWADIDRGEIIWSLDRPPGKGSIAGQFYFNRTNLTGGPFLEMGRTLFNLLEQQNGPHLSSDIRRYAFVDPTSRVDNVGYVSPFPNTYTAPDYTTDPSYKQNDVLCIDKYPGKTGADLNSDLKVFRVSEMYFIRAEALIVAGDLPGAALAIKAVRDARAFRAPFPALPVYGSPAAAWADVLLERRLELCYEGHRYIDLKRLGALAGVGIDRYTRDCEWVNTCSIGLTDFRFTAPIPINEMNANPNMEQNPDYH